MKATIKAETKRLAMAIEKEIERTRQAIEADATIEIRPVQHAGKIESAIGIKCQENETFFTIILLGNKA